MEYIDNTPNAAKLMESMRSAGYDNYAAICDIIDNSFDANADMVKVSIGNNNKVDGGVVISIADNGDGMDEETLSEALKLGSLTEKDTDSLGKYGMGMITASISLGRRLVVITKHNGQFLTGIQDLDDIVSNNKFIKTIRRSTNLEIMDYETRLGGATTGTLVNITKIDNLKNRQIASFQNTLIKKCGQIYRYFLNSNKKIIINSKQVNVSDPMHIEDDQTQVLVDTTQDFNVKGEMLPIRLRIVMLPLTAQTDPDHDQSQITQGFYLLRNNREILAGSNLNKMFTKHNYANRFRAEIFFSSEFDDAFGVRFTKDGSDGIREDIYSWIERNSTPQINAIKSIAAKIGKNSKEKTDHTPSERTIISKASTLKKPKIESIPNIAPVLKDLKVESFTNVKFTVDSNTRLAPLFQFEIVGKEVQIHYNEDHPFYERVFADSKTNPTLASAIDFIVYSLTVALVDITSTEDRWKLQEEFLDKMSDNLRALLT